MTQKQIDTSGTDTFVIVDPAAEIQISSSVVAPRLVSLAGVRIGIVDNSKHNAVVMLKEVEAVLKNQFGVGAFEYYRKDNPSIPMPQPAIVAMAERCQAIIHGVAD